MKHVNLIKPQKILAKLIHAIKEDPDDQILRRQAREKSIQVLFDYYTSINIKPKWSRQQWRNFIDTWDVDLSRPYQDYHLIGIKPSLQVNLPQTPQGDQAPAAAVQGPADQDDHDEEQDSGSEEQVHQSPPKPIAGGSKKDSPANTGFFGALVRNFANVFGG